MTIEDCKSYGEMGRFLGYNYYNKSVKNAVIKFCKLKNLNPEEIISKNSKKPNKCLYCGKELTGNGKYTKKFCNNSCSASFNNTGRVCTEETRHKIKTSLQQRYKDGSLINGNLGKYKNNTFVNFTNEKNVNNNKYRKCVICGCYFAVGRKSNGRYSRATTCSEECCNKLKSLRSKESAEKLISEGRHVGWKSRNIISYPEQFWMKVLENNNIKFKHNFPFGKYFLDFYIEISNRKIDLEIDGKQHKYPDRQESDIKRDKFVTTNDIEVYRIEWNSINTEDGKKIMKEKIENFLKYIKK